MFLANEIHLIEAIPSTKKKIIEKIYIYIYPIKCLVIFLFPIMHLLNKIIWFSITIARSKIKQYDFLSQLREVI